MDVTAAEATTTHGVLANGPTAEAGPSATIAQTTAATVYRALGLETCPVEVIAYLRHDLFVDSDPFSLKHACPCQACAS